MQNSNSSPFEITRRNAGVNASAVFTLPGFLEPAPRGLALGAHATDSEKFDLAQHNTFMGHLTRQVRTGGMTLTDRTFGITSDTPVGVEAPFTSGQEVSIQRAIEIEAEGTDYLWTSGTGALDGTETPGQQLSFKDGRLRRTQGGELVNYVLRASSGTGGGANPLVPMTAGALRIRAEIS